MATGVVATAWKFAVVVATGGSVAWESSVMAAGVASESPLVAAGTVVVTWRSSAEAVSVAIVWDFSGVATDKGVEDKVDKLEVLSCDGFLSSSRPISFSRVLLNSLETSYKSVALIKTKLVQKCG